MFAGPARGKWRRGAEEPWLGGPLPTCPGPTESTVVEAAAAAIRERDAEIATLRDALRKLIPLAKAETKRMLHFCDDDDGCPNCRAEDLAVENARKLVAS